LHLTGPAEDTLEVERGCKGHADHGQLSEFYAHIEAEQGGKKHILRQAKIAECTGEPHAVNEAKAENQQRPPGLRFLKQDILERRPGNGQRDQGLDDRR